MDPLLTRLHVPPRVVHGAIESAVLKEHIQERLSVSSREPSGVERDYSNRDKKAKDLEGKKRKCTYYTRKEEIMCLQDEIQELQARLHRLEQMPMSTQILERSQRKAMERNSALHEQVRRQHLSIVCAESLVGSYKPRALQFSPLSSFIKLTKDHKEREETLRALKMSKMENATEYMLTRSRFVDLTRSSRQTDCFEAANGDYVSVHWEFTPLPEATSVRQSLEAMLHFIGSQDISITDALGVMTIRECDVSATGDGTMQVRLLSSYDDGVLAESNFGAFSHYFAADELIDRPCALLIADHIEEDELHPYQSRSRLRRDVSSVIMVTECARPSMTYPQAKPLIVLLRWAFIRTHFNPIVSSQVLDSIGREGPGRWCDVMLRCIRERLGHRR